MVPQGIFMAWGYRFTLLQSSATQPLTSLTTAQVVAELGWTRKAIKEVLDVTPTTMRPPYGDIGMLWTISELPFIQ